MTLSPTLELESAASPDGNLSVTAGMCLLEAEATAETDTAVSEHPFASFSAGACSEPRPAHGSAHPTTREQAPVIGLLLKL